MPLAVTGIEDAKTEEIIGPDGRVSSIHTESVSVLKSSEISPFPARIVLTERWPSIGEGEVRESLCAIKSSLFQKGFRLVQTEPSTRLPRYRLVLEKIE